MEPLALLSYLLLAEWNVYGRLKPIILDGKFTLTMRRIPGSSVEKLEEVVS